MRLDQLVRWFRERPRNSQPRRRVQRRRLVLECLEERTVPAYVVQEFTLPNPDSGPHPIVAGPDGNVWFMEYNRNALGWITPAGEITEVPLPISIGNPGRGTFIFGPDGNIWVASGDHIAEITPQGDLLHDYLIPSASNAVFAFAGVGSMTFGPDGNIWYTESYVSYSNNVIGRLTPDGEITEFTAFDQGFYGAAQIINGPDGNLWYEGSLDNLVGHITTEGVYGQFRVPWYAPRGLTFGPDGNLWMTTEYGGVNEIFRVTPQGQLLGQFALPSNSRPYDMTVGEDGALWFAQAGASQVGRITMDGTITQIPIPTTNGGSYWITSGPDGNIWFTEHLTNKIGRIVLNEPPTADANGPYTVVRGGTVTLDASGSSDPDQDAATLSYAWDFDGDSQYDDATGMHPVFSAAGLATGSYTVGLLVTDEAGETDTATAVITVAVTALLPDPCDASKTGLFIGGTQENDLIEVRPSGNAGAVEVFLNGASQGVHSPTGGIVVYAQGGNDEVEIAGSISRSAWLFGGAGADRLKGGAGHDVLMGDAGDDLLVGSAGRDLLTGGQGADRVVGNADDDILIAGYTLFDDDLDELCDIMEVWTSTQSYAERTTTLMDRFITEGDSATVFDDGSHDVLTGSAGQDWFFAQLDDDEGKVKDKITDLSASEFASDLEWILA
jgi:virginiamycin B lyase